MQSRWHHAHRQTIKTSDSSYITNLRFKTIMILSGDIGGTNTRLGLFTTSGTRLTLMASKTYPSRDHESLDSIIRLFTQEHTDAIDQACFAIAGPVSEGRVTTTNLAWIVDAEQLAAHIHLPGVRIINDLEAIGYGLGELDEEDMAALHSGVSQPCGNLAIIAAGTGLGEAGCYWNGDTHLPFACEGGHVDFAPRSQLEMDLFHYLQNKFDRVSYERVLSGSGLFEIYTFLHQSGRGHESHDLTEVLLQQGHPAPIVRAALESRSTRCVQAVQLFVSLYGAEAGNLALKLMATGGVYLGGGIAPRLLHFLQDPLFMQAFTAKGRMKPLLEGMPVRVILNDKTGLFGAARCALGKERREC